MWLDVVWSVSVFVVFNPAEMNFIFVSMLSSIDGHCLLALAHCLGDQIHKQADFCIEQFFLKKNGHNSHWFCFQISLKMSDC